MWFVVFLNSVIPGCVPAFEEGASDVKTAWLGDQKTQAWQKAYKEMHQVHILLPARSDKDAAQSPVPSPETQVPAPSGEGLL